MNFVSSTTKRVLLRPIEAGDCADFVAMFTDSRFVDCFGVSLTASDIFAGTQRDVAHWEQHHFGCWSCQNKENGRFIGRCGLRYVEIDGVQEVSLDYAIVPEYWQQGYATEVAAYALQFGFHQMRFDSIVCFTLPSNKISQKVMENLGFTYEKNIVYKERSHLLFRLLRTAYLH